MQAFLYTSGEKKNKKVSLSSAIIQNVPLSILLVKKTRNDNSKVISAKLISQAPALCVLHITADQACYQSVYTLMCDLIKHGCCLICSNCGGFMPPEAVAVIVLCDSPLCDGSPLMINDQVR